MSAKTRSRPLAMRIALVAASTLVSLLLAEGAYRGSVRARRHATREDAGWYANRRRMNATIYRRSDDPRAIYEPAPGVTVAMPYGPAGFNAAAMRDDREHARTPDARTRVAMIGDSLVWGEDLDVTDALPRQVERAMGGAARAEVLGFGVTGYDTAQELAWFEKAVRPFAPSVVVLVYCMNDVMIASGPFGVFATPDERRARDAQEALLDRLAPVRQETLEGLLADEESHAFFRLVAHAGGIVALRRFERDAFYRDEYTVLYAEPAHRARVASSLAAMGTAIRATGARAVLVVSPVLDHWDHYHWRAAHAFVRTSARAAGFTVADPLDDWARSVRAEDLRLPGDNLHYGREGTRRLAAVVVDSIAQAARPSR